jgi:hypothetical protein
MRPLMCSRSHSGQMSRVTRAIRESLRLDPFRRFARMFLIESLLHGND